MAGFTKLLEVIEDGVTRGEHIAVVRILNLASGENATLTVSRGALSPPLEDSKLRAQVLTAVQNVAARGSVADLVDGQDEQGSSVTLVVEIIKPKPDLVVFGGGHVGQAVALIGALVGYDVTVVDDRKEFASRNRLPDPRIALLVSDYASTSEKLRISSSTVVVIVTRGHQYDELCLKNVVRSDAAYVGMIGSRKRVMSVFQKLAAEGFSEADLQRVHAPIGLQIGAKSPQEIAVSILAEIIDHVNNPHHERKGERNGI